MKYCIVLVTLLSACSGSASRLAHLEAERDFHAHQFHTQQAHEKGYNPEHVDDCYYYKQLICKTSQ
jgi:hypothetical protein